MYLYLVSSVFSSFGIWDSSIMMVAQPATNNKAEISQK